MKSIIFLLVILLVLSLNQSSEAKVRIRDLHLNPQDDLQSLVLELGGEAWFNIGKKGRVISLKIFNVALEPNYDFGGINSSLITGTLISESSPETVEVKLLLSRENIGFGTRTLEGPFRIVVDLYPEDGMAAQDKRKSWGRSKEIGDLKKVSPVQQEKKVAVTNLTNKTWASQHAKLKKESVPVQGQEKKVFPEAVAEKKENKLSESKKKGSDILTADIKASTAKAETEEPYMEPVKVEEEKSEHLSEDSDMAEGSEVTVEKVDRRNWRTFAREIIAEELPTPLPVDENEFFKLLIEEVPGAEGAELFMDGAIALKEGRKGEASITFESLVNSFPDSVLLERVAFLKGLTLLRNSDLPAEKGMRYLEGAARDYPDSVFAPIALLIVAQEYTKLKFYPEAMGLYKRIASQYPDSLYEAKILLGIGKIFKARKMFKKAEEQFREAFQKAIGDDDKATATFELAIMLSHLGKTLSALKLNEEAHKKWPTLVQKYAEATLMLGENYMSTGAYEDARETFNNLMVENPKSDITSYLKIRISDSYLKEDKIAQAENGYSSLISESDDGMVFGKLALADLKITGPEEKMAVELYKDIERSFPDHKLTEFVLFKRGMIELEKKNYKEGFYILNDLVDRYPKGRLQGYVARFIRSSLREMVINLFNNDRHLEIIKIYSENKKWFADERLLLKVAEAFVDINLPGEAKKVLKGVRKGIHKGDKLFWTGKVAFVEGDMENAETQLLDFVERFPRSQYYQEGKNLLGEIYYRNKNYKDAVAQYSSLGSFEPSSRSEADRAIYLHAAKSFQKEGFFSESAKYYMLALKAAPFKDGDIGVAKFLVQTYSDLGSLYFSEGRFEDALQSYQKGLDIEERHGMGDESPWVLFRMGECYEKLKNKSMAKQAFSRAKGLDNDLIGSLAEERVGGVGL